MKTSIRFMAAASREIIERNDLDFMMQTLFYIGKDGDVQLCFGDTIKSDENLESRDLTESAYPNQGEMLQTKEGLWLSMFTRHFDDALL